MAAPEILPMFGLGVMEKSRPSSAQSRVNLYLELKRDADRTRMVAFKTPGLDSPFVSFGDTPSRGVIWPPDSDYCFFVHRETFWQVDNVGSMVNRGTLNTAMGKVSMAQDGRYVGIVDGTNGYYYDLQTPATPLAQITSVNFPNGSRTLTWQDGFWLASLAGDLYQSDYGDITTWPGDFGTAESNPDNIVRQFSDEDDTKIFGSTNTEFWSNTGAADFSFERIPGTTQKWGLAARESIATFDQSVAFLARSREGPVFAAVLRGYRAQRISDEDLEAKWAKYGVTADAVGSSYMLDGHPFYVLSFPSASASWLYDGSTDEWSQLVSYGLTRHRSELYFTYLGRTYCTDYENGNVYRVNPETFTDNGEPIVWSITGRHVFDSFRKIGIDAFQLDIETGVGLTTGQGSDPQVMLEISKDGGRTWGNGRWRSIGKKGKYKPRVVWRKCGRARDFTFRVSGSDPVKTAILGAGIQPRPGSS